jgi:hypothetical protein
LKDAPISFLRQDDYLVPCHQFAGRTSIVQALCKNGNNSISLWINIDFVRLYVFGYAQLCPSGCTNSLR